MSRPSPLQLEKLLQFLESNPGIAKGNLRSAHGRREVKRKWEELAPTLNSIGGSVKDARGWAKFWADKKFASKKLLARKNANLTGGDSIQPLSDLEERLVSLIGGTNLAEGNREMGDPIVIHVVPEKLTTPTPDDEVVVVKDEATTSWSESAECLSDKSQESCSSSPQPSLRRPKRIHRSKLSMERERLIRVEEKRAEAELANAAGWTKLVQAIDNLANAIIFSGNRLAEALEKHK